MFKKLLLFSCLALSMVTARAAYVPVVVTGFNADVVANGAGPASASTSSTLPAASASAFLLGNYAFMAPDFNPAGTTPTSFLPANGIVNSASTSGLSWQLQSYSANNALFLVNIASDSLVFVTPRTAGEVEVLASAPDGGGGIPVTMTVNFTDGTTESFNRTVADWYNGTTGVAIQGLGRVNLPGTTTSNIDNAGGTNPRLYEYKLALSAGNFNKNIRSVTFAKTATGAELVVMGISVNTPCSGTPTAGAATTASTSVCPNASFTLTLPTATTGPGITYQWQSSTDGGITWSNVASANGLSYTNTAGIAAPTAYRAYLTCTVSSASDTSTAAAFTLKPTNQCYCVPTVTSTADEDIFNVTFGSLNNTSDCNSVGPGPNSVQNKYSNYTTLQPSSITIGTTVPFSIQVGTCGTTNYSNMCAAWLDLNQDGTFDNINERVYISTSSTSGPHIETGTYQIPAAAVPGVTRLRVMNYETSTASNLTPCATPGFGEVEDYVVKLLSSSACAAPANQPTSLVFTPANTSINLSFTPSVPAADAYLILRTPGTATPSVTPANSTSYSVGGTLGNSIVISSGSNITAITDATVTPGTQYRYTVYAYSDYCQNGPVYNGTTPLTGTTTTVAANTYTWNGSVSTDWQVAGNWTPNRTTPATADVLQFNNGITNNVTNVPTQTVGRVTFSNNTTATLKAQTGAARTLTLASDNLANTNELDIAAGSSMVLNDTVTALTIKHAGTGATGRIAGTFEINNRNSVTNAIDFTNAIDTVTTTGTIAAGGTVNTSVFTSTAANLVINGNYVHKYTTVGGGAIPTATWSTTSGVQITSYTTATGGPNGGLGQVFNNFTYNAPAQTSNSQWSGTIPGTVNGTLSVISTGTGQWLWATTTTYTVVANNYVQSGGVVDLGTGTGAKTVNVAGTFTQSGGILKASGGGAVTLHYNGTTAPQIVTFLDSAASGPIVYRVSNPYGIYLNGTGALSSAFKINSGGGVQITTNAANPIMTSLALTYFATGTTLTYDGTANQAITAAVWPATNGPLNFVINNTGATPANQVTLPGSRTLGTAGVLTLNNGVLNLGGNSLTLANTASGAISVTSPSATKMIVADGAGQLIRGIATAATAYLFPVGDQTGTAEYSPVSLSTTSTGVRLMGVRVVNAHNPNDASTNYLNRYWVITDTATSAYTYNGTFTYTAADVVGTEASLRLSGWNGTTWNQIPSLANTGVLTIQGTQSSTLLPLGGTQVTGRTAAANNIYTWAGNATNTDYQVPSNWTPARNVPDPSDILQFNNGIVDTVKNVPTQTITRMTFTNNTTALFQSPGTNTLTIQSDNVATTDELSIAAGSSLISNGTSALTLAFAGTGATVTIAGVMESRSNAVNNVFNFTNAVATVTATGSLKEGGSNGGSAIAGTTATNLLINGTLEYKYTTSNPGLPTASWNTGSTLLLTGCTTQTGGPNGGQNQAFYNVTYNCPDQTVASNWSGTGATTVTNNLSVISTGTGSWVFASTQPYTANINNFIQTGGTFNLASGVSTGPMTFNVAGTFNQTGGTFTATGASTGANAPVVNFNGTAAQNVTFFTAAPVGPVTYRISNPAGINLTGAGTFASTFALNNNGGVRISTTAAAPITSAIPLAYATGSTLTYDQSGNATATATVWPATSGPANVTINTGGSANIVTLPFSRGILTALNMTSGDIDVTSNTLTLGTAAATPGTLNYTAGNIRVTTGTFNRFFGITGLPTTATSNAGLYPIANSTGANRNVNLYFNNGTALTTGGSIAVGHTDATGLATIAAVTDATGPSAPYSIDRRTNASWNLAQTGIVLGTGNSIGIRLAGQGLINSNNPANLRVMQPAAIVGTYVATTGISAQRAGLAVADLSSPYHIGANATDIAGAYIAVTTGNWSNTATWLGGLVPAVTNDAFINPGVVVTADAATNTAKSLTILPGGTLTANSNTVTIDSAILNNGAINIGGGTLLVNGNSGVSGVTNAAGSSFTVNSGTATVGPAGGGNKQFVTSGTLTVSGGTLNVNGNFLTNPGSVFTQSGGNINVDGNAGSNAANSVANGTTIVSLGSQLLNLTGGTFTIVDPHPNSNSNRTFDYNTALGNVSAGLGHTFAFGNGTSTDTTANNTNGFRINQALTTSRLSFGNLVINGAAGTNRFVSPGNALIVSGNMTINSGGEYRTAGSVLYLAGNLTVNTGGTMTSTDVVQFTNTNVTTSSGGTTTINLTGGLTAQTVSGAGTFRNAVSATPGAFFSGLTLRNSNNVTFNIGNLVPFSGTVTFVAGLNGPSRLILPTNGILFEISGASNSGPSQANGWVVSRYQKAASAAGNLTGTMPIGDLNYYSPVSLTTAPVTTPGAIWAGVTSGDQPNIATSAINGSKSVNRYFTLSPANGIVFGPNATFTVNWNAADVDAGANTGIFSQGKYAAAAWTYTGASGQGATSLNITGADLNVAGDYAVGEPCSPINITTQPANVTACIGGPATLSVGLAATNNVTYQWQKGTTNVASNGNGPTYTIPAVSAADAGTYRVVITSNCASVTTVTSANATLTINTPAAITTQPANTAACEGGPATLSVVATGTGITYQWTKNGNNIPGATSASYTIPVASYADTANYAVVISGTAPCGYITSAPAALTIKPLPLTITASGPLTFCPGGSVMLNGPVTTPTNTLTYVWNIGGSPITPAQTNQTYTATAGGSYTATVTNTANGCSNTSNAIVISVNGAPQATITPAGTASFCQGDSIKLRGLSTPGLTYQWFNGTTLIPNATDSVYWATTAGSYTSKVSIGSGCSTTSTPTVVSINALPTITTIPTGNQTICQNDTLLITAFYTGATPVWNFNGAPITPAATGTTYKATAAGNYTVTVTSTTTGCKNTSAPVTLILNQLPTVTVASANATSFCAGGSDTLNASPTTGLTYVWNVNGNPIAPAATNATYVATTSGSYTVTVTNSNGCKRTSTPTVITANPLPSVAITNSLPLTMCSGQTNNLCVPAATGQTYQWSNASGPITGATAACYAATVAGVYSVKATITATGCTATSVLNNIVVNPTPTATVSNPAGTTLCSGDTVCMNANTGAGLSYQWNLNGNNPIVGATAATYCATATGNYTVTVTNGFNCSATSAVQAMTFNPRPSAIISYTTPVTFCDGGAVVLTGVSNTGITYQWMNNGSNIPGATANNYIASQTGNYSVKITNSFGCSTTSQNLLVVNNPIPNPVITRSGQILSTGSYATYQWYLNSQRINGATNQSYLATQNGGYAVAVTDANGCTNYSPVFFLNNVGVSTLNPASVKVFPNPVRSILNINAPVQVNVIIRDLAGREVMKVDDAKQIDMSRLADGTYMLMINDKNGMMIKTDKVIKIAD